MNRIVGAMALWLAWSVGAAAQPPDFAHASRPHLMAKNPYVPLTPDTSFYVKPRIGTMPLLVVLVEFSDSPHLAEHNEAYFDDLVFGAMPSVNSYFREVSYGKFNFTKAGITGWHRASRPVGAYFDANNSIDPYATLAAEGVQLAAQSGFNFRPFDRDGNNKITQDELVVLLVVADHGPFGLPQFMMTRPQLMGGSGVSVGGGLIVDTTAVRVEENLRSGGVRNNAKGAYVSYYAHELGHAAFSLPDLYGDNFGEDSAEMFTIMSTAGLATQPHLDPWAKIHLGWLTPTLIAQSGWITIKSTEKNPEAYVISNPARGGTEYFILENRYTPDSPHESPNGTTSFFESGLAVWHITEFYDNVNFDFNRGRQMVGMKHAGGTGSNYTNPQRALWDASDPQTAYNLTDSSSPRTSRWSGSVASGIRLLNVSAAGPEMRVYVQLDADSSSAPALLASPDGIAFQAAGSAAPPSQYVRVSNRGGGSLSASVNSSASWLTVRRAGGMSATLASGEGMTIEVLASAAGLSAGQYQGSISITSNAGTATIPVTLTVSAGAGATVQASDIVNAASFQRGPVAPGEIVSIFTMGYGPPNPPPTAFDARGYVDTVLGGTRVLFDGVPAPMIYSSNRQINVIVPYELAGNSTAQMQIEYGNSRSNVVSVPVAPSAPGVFLANGRAIVLNQDGTLNAPQNPAAQGSIVVLFLTGEGQTNPPGENGKPALTEFPVPVLPVTVRIAGVPARLAYAGAAPLFTAGLMQINAEVPGGNSGTALLTVQVGQASAPNSVIYVAPR